MAKNKASGYNFTNVLQSAFTLADPKSAKKTVKSSSCFTLLGSASVKAAHRMLVKLTPGIKTIKDIILLTFQSLQYYSNINVISPFSFERTFFQMNLMSNSHLISHDQPQIQLIFFLSFFFDDDETFQTL